MSTAKHFIHLTLEMRVAIENYVTEGKSLAFMAEALDVSATSISREIRRNRRYDGIKEVHRFKSRCVHRQTCKLKGICDSYCKKAKCSSCGAMCREDGCEMFEEQICVRTHKSPWVCNGCKNQYKCPLEHYRYSARLAQAKADERLRESREGLDMTEEDMEFLAREVRTQLKLGQSVHHIFASRDDLPCSERSFYRHVENEDIDIKKMELRKKVKYKRRKGKRRTKGYFVGHEYSDFLALDKDTRSRCVQMDCVEGKKGDSQVILTLHFVGIRFQIYLLLEKKDSTHVVETLNWMEELCGGKEAFKDIFGLILADRGSEFEDIEGIERDGRCSVYYTDPQRPDQKGGCEKNHEELRKIILKGTSIDALDLDTWIMAGICSHANSSLRLSIGNASPMALAKVALPASLLDGLGLCLIAPKDVETRPGLIDRLKQERDNKNR